MTTEMTVTLILKSKFGMDNLQVPESLWLEFEKRAREMDISPERLLIAALADFIVKEKRA